MTKESEPVWQLKDYQVYSVSPQEITPEYPDEKEFEMSFRPNVRRWWMEVGGWRCQFEFYDERRGWRQCKERAKEVHHIIGEAETLHRGEDPNQNVGLPLCRGHHTKYLNDEAHAPDFAFHTDIARSRDLYPEWKRQQQHFNTMSGRRRIPYEDSPFADVAGEHRQKAARGERYINGSEEIDQYYIEKMQRLASAYVARIGKRKPESSPHPETDTSRKKHWTDWFKEGVNEEDY